MIATVERDRVTSRARSAEHGLKHAGRHGRDPRRPRSSPTGSSPSTDVRLHRHERPHPVHPGGRPAGSAPSRRSRTRGSPLCCSLVGIGRRRGRRSAASRSACAARPPPTRCSPSCWSASGSRACRCRRRPSQMSAYPSRGTPSTTQAHRRGGPGGRRGRRRREAARAAADTIRAGTLPPAHPCHDEATP